MKETGPPCQGGPDATTQKEVLHIAWSHISDPQSSPQSRAARQLELLALRAFALADRVASGELAFTDAIDCAYTAAVAAGLTETLGDDVVQCVLDAAFAPQRRLL